jgi:hypothetical protein
MWEAPFEAVAKLLSRPGSKARERRHSGYRNSSGSRIASGLRHPSSPSPAGAFALNAGTSS